MSSLQCLTRRLRYPPQPRFILTYWRCSPGRTISYQDCRSRCPDYWQLLLVTTLSTPDLRLEQCQWAPTPVTHGHLLTLVMGHLLHLCWTLFMGQLFHLCQFRVMGRLLHPFRSMVIMMMLFLQLLVILLEETWTW